MYYTYVLISQKDGNRYVGFAKDLDLRMKQHNSGKVRSTVYRRPLDLIYFEVCMSKDDAVRREKYFKTHWGRLFLAKRLKVWLSS